MQWRGAGNRTAMDSELYGGRKEAFMARRLPNSVLVFVVLQLLRAVYDAIAPRPLPGAQVSLDA